MSEWLALEGVDGAGKTTALVGLKRAFEAMGKSVTVLRHPGSTAFGEYVRREVGNVQAPAARTLIWLAAWIELTDGLESRCIDDIVLFDRTWLSMLPYQNITAGAICDIAVKVARCMHTVDYTFILTATYDTHVARLARRNEPPYSRAMFEHITRTYEAQCSPCTFIVDAEQAPCGVVASIVELWQKKTLKTVA